MQIDASCFPMVRLDYDAVPDRDTDTVLADMDALLARATPFVYIASGGFGEREANIDERRKVASWMKANKPAITAFIKANIHIAGNADEHAKALEFSRYFENFWGYPMVIVANTSEAEAKAEELLG